MLKPLAEYLQQANLITAEQLNEAECLCHRVGGTLATALVTLGYLTGEQVARALAVVHGLPFINLAGVSIPPAVLESIPESVCRENTVLPLLSSPSRLVVVVADPGDRELLQKLQFILNRDIDSVVAAMEQLVEAINRNFGDAETESADYLLSEFTDTAIDFSASDRSNPRHDPGVTRVLDPDKNGEVDSVFDEELVAADSDTMSGMAAPKAPPADHSRSKIGGMLDGLLPDVGRRLGRSIVEFKKGVSGVEDAIVERHATVRYYSRMNPLRMFPLLVILSKKAIQEVVKKHVTQARSKQFQVALDSTVEIEPILPGCQVYPPRDLLKIADQEVSSRFHVVPHVLGEVMQARVVIRQDGQFLAEVPLQIKVVRQSATLLVGLLSFLLPFGFLQLQHFGLDFDSQARQGYGFYAQATNWLMAAINPELLTAGLLGLTVGVWFWLRPRQRDVFWDIAAHDPRRQVHPDRNEQRPARPAANGQAAQSGLFQQAVRNLRWQKHALALHYFEKGLALGPASLDTYADAALAAHGCGRIDRALELLQQAEAQLGSAAIKGALRYHMASLATRLGRFDDAMQYLNQAMVAGYATPERMSNDPELAPLRGRADFQWLAPV